MEKVDRRTFLKTAAVLTTGLTGISPSRQALSENMTSATEKIPTLTLGGHRISRLIIGGNPFSFNAHSEPLIYSRELFQHYFTREKVVETLLLAAANGINTFLGRTDENVFGLLKHYQEKTGKAMPWIAQTSKKPMAGATKTDILANIKLAANHGAIGCYFHGESADFWVKQGKISEIAECVDYIRKLGLIAGVGGHEIGTIESLEKAGVQPDFYMKTFNRMEFCCPDFERTREVMAKISTPWIAFKVLAAGRMKPEEGFAAALQAGADFLCVGMFDFQVERNTKLFSSML